MLGLLVSAGHQQVWHWLCDINGSWSSSLNHLNVEKCPIQSINSCLCFLKAVQHKGVNCKSFSYSTTNMNWGSLYNANPRCLKSPTIWQFDYFFNNKLRLTTTETSLKNNIKNQRLPMDSPHKRPLIWKVFPCHNVIMYNICVGLLLPSVLVSAQTTDDHLGIPCPLSEMYSIHCRG